MRFSRGTLTPLNDTSAVEVMRMPILSPTSAASSPGAPFGTRISDCPR